MVRFSNSHPIFNMSLRVCEIVRGALLNYSFVLLSICLLFSLQCDAKPNDGDMMFPEGDRAGRSPKCTGANNTKVLCTEVENYPATQLESLLKKDIKRYMEIFGEDFFIDLGNRFDGPVEEFLCHSKERVVFPKIAKNKDDQDRVIVNFQEYKQGIRIEECVGDGETCLLSDSFPNNYKTECRQMYTYRPLLSLSPGGVIVKDQFRIPSSCKCVLKSSVGPH